METVQTRRTLLKPPVLYGLIAAAGLLLHSIIPAPMPVGPLPLRLALGLLGVLAGTACVAAATREFKRANTNVVTTKPVLSLVDTGIYGVSRNPIYLGFTLMLLGVAVLSASWWLVAFAPLSLVLVYVTVVKREEQLLTRQFGPPYEDYCRRVRRWI